jgi:NADPH-dependent 2,4-dienoyl-CoA reductase/sulfur reductase-like enzyme
MKVVVVGINHAGTSAIRTMITQNPKLEVVAYDQNTNISFLGCGIALTVGGIVKDLDSLFYANSEKLSAMGATIKMEHQVLKIDPDNKEVTVKNLVTGDTFTDSYDKLVYAAGSWPIDVPIKNKELKNINICKLYQHAQILIEKANDPLIKKVAVIGSGYIGIELAEAYHQKGKEVVLIDCIARVVPRYFDVEFTNRLQKDMTEAGINLVLGAMVTEYIDDGKGKVCGVITTKGNYDVDLVIDKEQCIAPLLN